MTTLQDMIKLFHAFQISVHTGQMFDFGIWNYLLLAGLVAVEGPIATLLGAAAASAGIMRPNLVFVFAAVGNLSADALWYTLGYAGRVDWLLRFGKYIGLQPHLLDRLTSQMHEHAAKILLVAKLTAAFMIPSLVAAGLTRVPWRRWFPAILFGETLWTGGLVLVGFYATSYIARIQSDLKYVALAGSLIIFVLLARAVQSAMRHQQSLLEDIDQPGDNRSIKG